VNQKVTRQLRTLLVLGRVANLPTVWSDCVAGWWLGGGGNYWKLPLLLLGVSALYVGGMFLNDAFDTDYDRQFRVERPIPSGAISQQAVGRWGWAWLGLGWLCLLAPGLTTGALGLVLIGCIVVYAAAHKAVTISPWLIGVCRFFIYAIASAVGAFGITGWAIWCGLALGAYATGVGFLERRQYSRGIIPRWPLILLAVPIFLALVMNARTYRKPALLMSLVLLLWSVRYLRVALWTANGNLRRAVAGLLAGIIFVDWLAIAPECPRELGFVFLLLLGGTLLAQRFAPSR
jgi:4-hydroxybenzoate polyprenyltransferase